MESKDTRGQGGTIGPICTCNAMYLAYPAWVAARTVDPLLCGWLAQRRGTSSRRIGTTQEQIGTICIGKSIFFSVASVVRHYDYIVNMHVSACVCGPAGHHAQLRSRRPREVASTAISFHIPFLSCSSVSSISSISSIFSASSSHLIYLWTCVDGTPASTPPLDPEKAAVEARTTEIHKPMLALPSPWLLAGRDINRAGHSGRHPRMP